MTPADVFNHWTNQRYMDALAAAWQLGRLYTYPSVQRKDINLTLRELIFRACREAVAAAQQGRDQEVQQWLEGLLHKFSPPPALINHGEDRASEREKLCREKFRSRMILAHLRCAEVAINRQWTSQTIDAADLRKVAEDTGLPIGFLLDVVHALLPEAEGGGQPRPPVATCTLTVLLVEDTAPEEGVVADFTLERLSDGTGSLYPIPELAFVYRDAQWRRAERQAYEYVQRAVSSPAWDVRWRLVRRDQKSLPPTLQGDSLGAALAPGADQTGGWPAGPQPGGRQPLRRR